MTTFETVLVVASAIGVFAVGWLAGTHYTWGKVRRTMVEAVAMRAASERWPKGKKK